MDADTPSPRPARPALPEESAEELHAHTGFLRRVARGLLYDGARAEDAVQEAWLAALRERPGRPGSAGGGGAELALPARGWLAGAVRRLAHNRRREEARRARRESSVARPEAAVPAAVDVAARLELSRRVTRAVEGLDEPYRTAVVLRFFDGLPPRAIARRLGVPVNTVRTRVRRGLARLRATLDGDGAGDRSALLGALVPLAGAPPWPWVAGIERLADAASALQPSGVVLMSLQAKIVLASVVLVGALLVTWQAGLLRSAPAPAAPVSAVEPAETAAAEPALPDAEPAAPAEAPAPAEPVRAAAAPATDPAATWVVRGRAWIGRKTPAAGLAVELALWEGWAAEGEPARRATVTADDEGRFEWALMPPEGAATVTASSRSADRVCTGDEALAVPGAEPPQALQVMVYPLDSEIVGVVRGADGGALEGATVKALEERARTDGQGRFRLRATSHRGTCMLYAWADGHAEQRVTATPPPAGGRQEVEIVLGPAFAVRGRVVDEAGLPVAGARAGTFFTQATHVETDADGRFALEHLDPGRSDHMVWVRAEGYATTSETVETGARTAAEQEIVLERGVTVHGVVVDAAGAPLPGAELFIGFSPNAWNRVDAVARDGGAFELPVVGRGAQELWVQHAGLAAVHLDLDVPATGDRLDVGAVVLAPGRALAGTVIDTDGDPVAGLGVSVRYLDEYLDQHDRTDAEGRFRLEGLPDGELELELWGTGWVRHEQPVTAGETDLDVVMRRAGGLAGRVVDAATGEPVDVFRIRFREPVTQPGDERLSGYSAVWVREGQLFSGTGGAWDTGRSNLEPGKVIGVEASAEGYAPAAIDRAVVTTEPDVEPLVLRLSRGVDVAGRVVTRDGEPIADATVEARAADGREAQRMFTEREPWGRHRARTDANGRFVLRHLPSGPTRLHVAHPEWCPAIDGPIELVEGTPVPERWIELGAGSALFGRLLDAEGRTLAGERVELSAVEVRGAPGERRRVETDAEGAWRFDGLAPGIYRLAHAVWREDGGFGGFHDLATNTIVREGADHEVDLAPRGRCALEIAFESEHELPDVLVVSAQRKLEDTLASFDDALVGRGAFAPAEGFTLRGLTPGEYHLFVTRRAGGAHWLGQAQARVEEGTPARVTVEVRRQGE